MYFSEADLSFVSRRNRDNKKYTEKKNTLKY